MIRHIRYLSAEFCENYIANEHGNNLHYSWQGKIQIWIAGQVSRIKWYSVVDEMFIKICQILFLINTALYGQKKK